METEPKNIEDVELAKHIESLERALMQPEVRRSAEKLNELLADDFIEFGMFGGRYTKEDMLKYLVDVAEEEKNEKYEPSNFQAREIAPDTVLLTFDGCIKYLDTGSERQTLRSSIWQKRNGKWQIVFHQGTVVKETGNNNA